MGLFWAQRSPQPCDSFKENLRHAPTPDAFAQSPTSTSPFPSSHLIPPLLTQIPFPPPYPTSFSSFLTNLKLKRERERAREHSKMASLTSIHSTTLSNSLAPKPRLPRLHSKPRLSISCSTSHAQENQDVSSSLKTFSAAVALSSILLSSAAAPPPAAADIAGLTPCKESKAFAKREKQSLKKLEASLKKYAPDSAPALAIKATMEKTKRRFENYGKFGLLCGSDGLPHLIVSGDQRHWGEFITPGLIFLYIAGWIGWVGRSYLIAIRGEKKPAEKEIIIDVPLATSLLWRGFIWPVAAYRDLINGDLIADDADVTVV